MQASAHEKLSHLLDGRLSHAEASALRAEMQHDSDLAAAYERLQKARQMLRVSDAIATLPIGFDARLSKRLHRAKLEKDAQHRVDAINAKRKSAMGWVAAGVGGLAAGMALAFGVVSMLTPAQTQVGNGSIATVIYDAPNPIENTNEHMGVDALGTKGMRIRNLTRDLAQGKAVDPDYATDVLRVLRAAPNGSSSRDANAYYDAHFESVMNELLALIAEGKSVNNTDALNRFARLLRYRGIELRLEADVFPSESGQADARGVFRLVPSSDEQAASSRALAMRERASKLIRNNEPYAGVVVLMDALAMSEELDQHVASLHMLISTLNALGERDIAVRYLTRVSESGPEILASLDAAMLVVLGMDLPSTPRDLSANEEFHRAEIMMRVNSRRDADATTNELAQALSDRWESMR